MAERRRWEAATETMPLRHCPLAAATTESQQLHRQHCCDPRPGRRLAQANYCGLGRRARLPCALARPRLVTRMMMLPCLNSLLACYLLRPPWS